MEVFMVNISLTASRFRIITEIAKIVHGRYFAQFNVNSKLNFEVFLHHPKKKQNLPASYRTGTVTFPTEDIGKRFLEVCGGKAPRIPIIAGYIPINFRPSNKAARKDVVENIRRLPFQDPRELQKQEDKLRSLAESSVRLSEVQFGWECRDDVFSVEYAKQSPCEVHFSSERREFEIALGGRYDMCENITISFSQVQRVSASCDSVQASIYFSLYHAPKFEFGPTLPEMEKYRDISPLLQLTQKRSRMTSLKDDDHRRVAPYVSNTLRLVCTPSEYQYFVDLWRISEVNLIFLQYNYRAEQRRIFSSSDLDRVYHWMGCLEWPVAFHVDALIRNSIMDPKELLAIRPKIDRLLLDKGKEYSAEFLCFYREQLQMLWFSEGLQSHESPEDCFQRCSKDYRHLSLPTAEDLFQCLHVSVTPTGMFLYGPFPEQTNRVIRKFPDNKDHFLRVAFVEEDHLQLRFDSHVHGRFFIDGHVGSTLRNGLVVGGRRFDFLHYSQSALKDHAVWFVCPFYDSASRSQVDSESIIKSLGTFNNLPFDIRLMYCPARYAARISQAFTTTDSSITIDADKISCVEDIKSETGSCFTDGVGTVSPTLATEMWKLLCAKKRRGFRSDRPRPRAFQIRFQGSKGMISVDHTLRDRELVLRASMIKFEATTTTQIEIAGVFNKPGRMYLNRPLIMLLEGLGVPGYVFLELQRRAVEDVMDATSSVQTTATMLENYGLGQSFRLTSVLRNLAKLDSGCIPTDSFYAKSIQTAIFHILRDFKHRARIPVPGWTLVGVADVHSYLEEGEVFVCIERERGVKEFVEGLVCISRSPTIHPGDVQLARAIGPPPPGSPFLQEALQNTLVFSTKGKRSLPSCLGGGDLDGDVYNITDYADLLPRQTCEPASYDPAQRKELDHPSTSSDVIDFIVDYIIADNVGIIATNWLIIADQSDHGIHDPHCLTLAKLHSDAVDYPKSGNSVPMDEVPRPLYSARPDWIEPESGQAQVLSPIRYYTSQRAIGQLYRNIDLSKASLQGMLENSGTDHLNAVFHRFSLSAETGDDVPRMRDPLWRAVKSKVLEFTSTLDVSDAQSAYLDDIFWQYSQHLRHICSTNTMSNKRHSRLTETEAFIGTIKARTSQRKKRTDLIKKLRDHTAQLVTDIKFELAGGDDMTKLDRLRMAWASWRLSMEKMKGREQAFGAPSFFWVALSALFDAIKSIEDVETVD